MPTINNPSLTAQYWWTHHVMGTSMASKIRIWPRDADGSQFDVITREDARVMFDRGTQFSCWDDEEPGYWDSTCTFLWGEDAI